MAKTRGRGGILIEIVANVVVASRPPVRRPIGTPPARANRRKRWMNINNVSKNEDDEIKDVSRFLKRMSRLLGVYRI